MAWGVVALACLLACASPAASSQLQPLGPDDVWNEAFTGDITPSPDGRRAAYVLSTINRKKNSYRGTIYEVDLSGSAPPRALTRGESLDSEPRYSPDGKWLAFISDRAGPSRLFLLPRDGGEPHAPFVLTSDMSSIVWSPDSTKLCFLSSPPAEKPATDVKVVTRYRYRVDGVGYVEEQDEQLYEGDLRTGQLRKITEGLSGVSDPVYSPDGRTIVFAANTTKNPDYNYNTDICAVASGGGKLQQLTKTPETEERPRYSPDGRRIAYLRSRGADDWYAMSDLWLMADDGSSPMDLTGRLDRNVAEEQYGITTKCAPRWSSDSKSIYVLLQDGPTPVLYRLILGSKAPPVKVLAVDGQIEYPFLLNRDRSLLHGRQSATVGTEVYVSSIDGKNARRLTFHQQDWLKERWIGTPERLPITSSDGTRIDGWILKPPGFDPSKKYPLILTIHGGPIWFYGDAFEYELQVWAAQGYIILYTNPRGSSGYGQAFTNAIKADWGNLDYQDLMAAVDAALAKGFVDERRMAVTGLSYGGIMTNWIIGHTNRFRTAISEEGICNYFSSFGTDDCQIDWESEYGLPWENEALYRKRSPITYARDVQTPLLIVHGEDDYRTNIQQAEEWYMTLKRLGKEVVFLRYPRESHVWRSEGEPEHRLDRMRRVLEWWKKYLS